MHLRPIELLRNAHRYWVTHGARAALRHTMAWIASRLAHPLLAYVEAVPPPKADVIGSLRFARVAQFGEPLGATHVARNTVNWVIPDVGIGSGGHLNIFRIVQHLERAGYDCRLVLNGGSHFPTEQAAKEAIDRHFMPLKAQVVIGERNMPPAWFTFASSWITAYTVRNFHSTRHKCYFVQDFEPYFYPHGTEFALAEQTYRFGFYGVTAGDWLADKLSRDYGMRTRAMGFACDATHYFPRLRRDPEKRRVLFYARTSTPRRGFELGLSVLDEVARRVPRFEAVLAGGDTSGYVIPFAHVNPGIMDLADLPELYSQCDAALVLSFTNLSLLPLEAMGCGCPIVSNTGPNVEWLLNGANAVLCEPTVEALTEGLAALLIDDAKRCAVIDAGLAFARGTDWAEEANQVVDALNDLDSGAV